MEHIFKTLSNTGTGLYFWLDTLIITIGIALFLMLIFDIVRKGKQEKPVEKRQVAGTVFKAFLMVVYVAFFAFAFGPGNSTPEVNPVDGHSLNETPMTQDSIPTKAELLKDDIENTDKTLLEITDDSALEKIEAKNQKILDETIEKWN